MHPLLSTVPVRVLTTEVVALIKLGELSNIFTLFKFSEDFVAAKSKDPELEEALLCCGISAADAGRAGGLAFRPFAKAGLEARW